MQNLTEKYLIEDLNKLRLDDHEGREYLYRKAFYELLEDTNHRAAIHKRSNELLNMSRFYRLDIDFFFFFLPQLVKVLESEVSNYHDMADCHGDNTCKFYWMDNAGNLCPVTVGKTERHGFDEENPNSIYYASASLIANGQEVGTVHYSDH